MRFSHFALLALIVLVAAFAGGEILWGDAIVWGTLGAEDGEYVVWGS